MIEEAVAELEALEYKKAYSRPEDRAPITKFLLKNNLRDDEDISFKKRGIIYSLSPQAITATQKGEVTAQNFGYLVPALAATGIQMLCEEIPGLRSTLRKTRSDEQAVAQVENMINEFQPGLYQKLSEVPYSFEGFAKGQALIEEAIESKRLPKKPA